MKLIHISQAKLLFYIQDLSKCIFTLYLVVSALSCSQLLLIVLTNALFPGKEPQKLQSALTAVFEEAVKVRLTAVG